MKLRFWLALFCVVLTAPAVADSQSPEVQLAKSLLALKEGRMDLALNGVDSLLKTNPNFKLAQLVKADLLMARAKPISAFGAGAANAPRDRVEDLRAEAQARLQRYQDQSFALATPRYLWRLDPQQSHALVVDASRSTLYVYENVNGEPRYVTDFYVTIGKLGAEKTSEGDKRTPIGVYFVKDSLPQSKLTDFYGNGAFPLSYPNEWDRKHGRDGHGIWLHGTPRDTYSRPPFASNGCVVLANEDLDRLGKMLQIGRTPIVIASQMEWATEKDGAERDELMSAIEQWRNDWSSGNSDSYLSHYAQSFSSEGMDYSSWAKHKRQVNAGKAWIKVNISGLSAFPYPGNPNMVVVNFEQDYTSSNLANRMKKRQYWIKQGTRWQIIYEGSA
ncbi:MAG: L,D-transpeptidase family protein [Nitrosomonadales bacterium]|nr:L,D-transpeptidase family protein [Nitrosomonadales bacterium]